MPKHTEVSQRELVNAIRAVKVRIVERITAEPVRGRGGYWNPNDPEWVTLGWRYFRARGHATEMETIFVEEVIHSLRPAASEWWVRRRAGLMYRDYQVQAETGLRLLNAVWYDDYVNGV